MKSFLASVVTSLLTMVVVTDGFMPTWYMKLLLLDDTAFKSSRTHHQIAEDALMTVVADELSRRSDVYPGSRQLYTGSKLFRSSVRQFTKGVEEVDSPFRTYRPEEHVDSETIDESHYLLRSLSHQIRVDILARRMDNARRKAGNALHTLQDFYSHSNWIEIGNNVPNTQFGSPLYDFVERTAGVGEKSCTSCVSSIVDKNCVGNSDPADSHNQLTTGYTSNILGPKDWILKLKGNKLKPSDKCSHGGIFDLTATTELPFGGINKDTTKSLWSPHAQYHTQAAAVAQMASINFIKNLRDQANALTPISDDLFDEFLGLVSSSTLCFVLGTTSSMSAEINAVKAAITNITRQTASSSSSSPPGDYVVVPFSDTSYGPVVKTASGSQMSQWLNSLTASGSSDVSTMSMHALQSAIGAVRSSSTCYVITDSAASDLDLYPVVKSLAIFYNIKLNFLLTDLGAKRRRRSSLSRRQRRTPSYYSYYDDLAKSTGGWLLQLTKSSIGSATTSVVSAGSRLQKVTVFIADNVNGQFKFYVDSSVTSIILQLSGSSSVTSFTSPSGQTVNSYTVMTNTDTAKLYNLGDLTSGLWTVTLSAYATSVVVTGSSPVNFDYQISVDQPGDLDLHGGLQEITGSPVSGSAYQLLTTADGAIDPFTGATTNQAASFASMEFVSPQGTSLTSQSLFPLITMDSYRTASTWTAAKAAFRVSVKGLDTSGNIIQRFDPRVVTPALTSISVATDSLKMSAGSTISVCMNVTSFTDSGQWYLVVSDTANYYTGSKSISVYLNNGQLNRVWLNFSSPADSVLGTVSTVTVAVSADAKTSFDNYVVFYLTTDDVTSPTVSVSDINPVQQCSTVVDKCQSLNWSVALVMQDTESGIKRVSVQPISTETGGPLAGASYDFQIGSFDSGTQSVVTATYSASCCSQTAIVRVLDVSVNVKKLVIGTPVKNSQDVLRGQLLRTLPVASFVAWLVVTILTE